ncbi:hypothetical protein SUGI_0828410 [Cryptomeria japonica]|uniref:uncharacterized protein LOC131060563 n=1 Tax=Cryptomeria japonica TaxID=3369 RepID=UPI0024147EB2|nr:uncharacterized protein LOC131060563 [Cryptomeria japonica]GLJ40303.1 hypothetical protein SUGI_0828410 [Cryptomeria japonica]
MRSGDNAGGESAKIICAICYEDVKPLFEDLQSVSLCGHVFHELCLQQWLEYSPPNKKASCPVCKHSCSGKDVHRLYFQSTSEFTQKTSSQTSSVLHSENAEVLGETVKKLECQLAVAAAALETQQCQMKELSEQISLCKDRAEKADAARAKAVKDKNCSEASLLRKQEELSKSTTECSKLLEKNTALAKELAAHKLVANLDLEEEQVLKLACVGRGSNTDDIIDTLRKSLVIRNKSYKELLEKCNHLGMGENHSLRKLEKAVERIKRLKARVQELERTLEEKENVAIRSLTNSNATQVKVDYSVIKKYNALNTSQDIKSTTPLNNFNAVSQKFQGQLSETCQSAQKNGDSSIMQGTERLQDFGVSNVSIIRCDENANDHISHDADQLFNGENEGQQGVQHTHSYPLTSKCTIPGVPHDLERVNDNGINWTTDRPVTLSLHEEMQGEPMGIVDDNSFLPIKREAGRAHLGSSLISEEPMTGGSIVSKSPNEIAGKWCRQAKSSLSSPGQNQETLSSGKFIAVGANGRGGQIKVLKNPRQPLDTGLGSLWSRQPKRCKAQKGKTTVNDQGALQIEHFFQRTSQN